MLVLPLGSSVIGMLSVVHSNACNRSEFAIRILIIHSNWSLDICLVTLHSHCVAALYTTLSEAVLVGLVACSLDNSKSAPCIVVR